MRTVVAIPNMTKDTKSMYLRSEFSVPDLCFHSSALVVEKNSDM